VAKLLTRDDFREGVFIRDGHRCVVCGIGGKLDAHHILERRLFSDGGYYLDNGASVCGIHHIACEATDISVEEIRERAGITKKVIPEHFYDDQVYDKWGNPILPNGTRLIGELFFDESVQKILHDKLPLFTHYVKYPRTTHVPWSPGMNEDDRILRDMSAFSGMEVVVTEKMDGENTTLYSDYIHARSLDGRNHPSRNWVKNFWSSIAVDIPERWRVCGENLYAKHSIGYDNLETYFYGFSIWNDKNVCLSWDETLEWFKLLNIEPVPVLYRGMYDEKLIKNIALSWDNHEGYVVRSASEFSFGEFKKYVAKCVRKGHIQTTKHWMHGQKMEVNELKEKIYE
jgi:hypothetical protein